MGRSRCHGADLRPFNTFPRVVDRLHETRPLVQPDSETLFFCGSISRHHSKRAWSWVRRTFEACVRLLANDDRWGLWLAAHPIRPHLRGLTSASSDCYSTTIIHHHPSLSQVHTNIIAALQAADADPGLLDTNGNSAQDFDSQHPTGQETEGGASGAGRLEPPRARPAVPQTGDRDEL